MTLTIFIIGFIALWVILGLIWFISKSIKNRIVQRDKFLAIIPAPLASASYQNIFTSFWNTAGDYIFIILVLFFVMVIGLIVWHWFKPPPVDN